MCDKRFIPDSQHLEELVYAIKHNAEREAQGYVRMIFAERIERVLESLPDESKDEFMMIAASNDYQPLRHQVRSLDAANDDHY